MAFCTLESSLFLESHLSPLKIYLTDHPISILSVSIAKYSNRFQLDFQLQKVADAVID